MSKQIILITGATGTLGRALVKLLDPNKFDLILLARNKKKLLDLDTDAKLCQMDLALAGPEAYHELFSQIQNQYGRLDGLIHLAGIFNGLTPLANHTPQQFFSIMQANCHARYLLTQTLLPLFKKTRGAHFHPSRFLWPVLGRLCHGR